MTNTFNPNVLEPTDTIALLDVGHFIFRENGDVYRCTSGSLEDGESCFSYQKDTRTQTFLLKASDYAHEHRNEPDHLRFAYKETPKELTFTEIRQEINKDKIHYIQKMERELNILGLFLLGLILGLILVCCLRER